MEQLLQLDDLVCLVKDKKANSEQKDCLISQTTKIVSSYFNGHSIHINNYDDIISSALLHIWENISNYDKERGNFSTWVYLMARVAWNYHCYDNKRFIKENDIDYIESNLKLMDYYKKVNRNCIDDIDIKHDVILAVQALFKKFKSKRKILIHLFGGNPFDKGYEVQYNDNLSEISVKSGVSWIVVKYFVGKKVIPFMKSILRGYGA